ncbi:MAG: multicopper oxidase domain-containing protein [Chromatiales bacterium]|nr:multicopper oxidase domain-containing protein [Chromatiales bacterium]
MTHSRREFLRRAGAAALLAPTVGGGAPWARAEDREVVTLHARPGTIRLAPADYPETPIWGYDARVPGPTIRVRQGERVTRRFVNGLPQPSTVHWHGIRIDNSMDGAPELTQPLVEPGADFLYDFEPPDAGTWWYHSHHRAFEQMARGLYGALVVEELEPPEVDREELLILDDWRLAEDASLHASFGALHDWAHAGRIGNWITVNGDAAWSREASRHERLRLRLLNAANARIFSLALKGLEGWVVALDGQPLPAPEAAGPFVLAPGQRADLIVDVVAGEGEEAFLVSREREDTYALAAFPVRGSSREARPSAPAPLPPNPVPALGDLAGARRATLRMDGGAMGRMREAVLGGRTMGVRELAAQGRVWAMNGLAEMPDAPFFTAAREETVRLAMINDTAWPHGMHLHGHHFRAIASDGTAGPLRDTLLVDRGESAEIAFVADNPGDWLLHCHMPEHSISGMTTWFRVV